MNPKLQRKLKRNKFNLALIAIAFLAIVIDKDNIAQNAAQMGQLRSKMQANSVQQMNLLASEDDQAEKEKIAIARYQRGCKFVVATKDPNSLVSLQEGRPVTDLTTGYPIAAGSFVCDEAGNTAEIIPGSPPYASRFAFTGNREVIEAAINRSKLAKLRRTKTNQK